MQDATVVTSENAAEFYAAKLNMEPATAPAEAEKSEPAVEQESSGEQATEQQENKAEAEEAPKKEPNPKLEKRFSELTKQREDARREAQREREAREAAERWAAELEAKLNPPKEEKANAKPTPNQFKDAFEYAEALAEWSAEQAILNREKQEAERKAQAEREKVVSTWKQRMEATKAELPDFDDMVSSAEVAVSNEVRDAILESEVGPKILYHLASNPEIAQGLATKSVSSALREIGKLEAKLSETKAAPKAVESAPKPSGAPAPITPVKGASSAEIPITSDGEFHGTYAQWKAARKAGKIN